MLPLDIARTLDGFRESVEKVPAVLKSLAEPNSLFDVQIGARKKSKGNKQLINTAHFDKLGLSVPSTQRAADELAAILLQKQKRILEVLPIAYYFCSVVFLPLLFSRHTLKSSTSRPFLQYSKTSTYRKTSLLHLMTMQRKSLRHPNPWSILQPPLPIQRYSL